MRYIIYEIPFHHDVDFIKAHPNDDILDLCCHNDLDGTPISEYDDLAEAIDALDALTIEPAAVTYNRFDKPIAISGTMYSLERNYDDYEPEDFEDEDNFGEDDDEPDLPYYRFPDMPKLDL